MEWHLLQTRVTLFAKIFVLKYFMPNFQKIYIFAYSSVIDDRMIRNVLEIA